MFWPPFLPRHHDPYSSKVAFLVLFSIYAITLIMAFIHAFRINQLSRDKSFNRIQVNLLLSLVASMLVLRMVLFGGYFFDPSLNVQRALEVSCEVLSVIVLESLPAFWVNVSILSNLTVRYQRLLTSIRAVKWFFAFTLALSIVCIILPSYLSGEPGLFPAFCRVVVTAILLFGFAGLAYSSIVIDRRLIAIYNHYNYIDTNNCPLRYELIPISLYLSVVMIFQVIITFPTPGHDFIHQAHELKHTSGNEANWIALVVGLYIAVDLIPMIFMIYLIKPRFAFTYHLTEESTKDLDATGDDFTGYEAVEEESFRSINSVIRFSGKGISSAASDTFWPPARLSNRDKPKKPGRPSKKKLLVDSFSDNDTLNEELYSSVQVQ